VRRVDVARIQNAARNAMEWFEVVGTRYADTLEPEQFMYSMLTRSQRISHENLAPPRQGVAGRLRALVRRTGGRRTHGKRRGPTANVHALQDPRPDAAKPHRGLADGDVFGDGRAAGDFHMVHLGARAMGGAALVFPEMTCVSPTRASRPAASACGTMNRRRPSSASSISCITRHAAKIGHPARPCRAQGCHEARLGGHRPAAVEEGMAADLSASALPYLIHSQTPRDDPRRHGSGHPGLRAGHGTGRDIGFDMLELHCGARLSAVELPVAAHQPRTDEYGGDHAARARYPARSVPCHPRVWPQDKPISVRLS
jgi:anthraniloyl-CoA monooxygenase